VSRFIDELKRTHRCGELRAADEGKMVVLFGWVASRRDHGGCVFADLRDRTGITQVVFDPAYAGAEIWAAKHGKLPEDYDPELTKAAHALAEQMRSEWVVGVRGVVVSRGANKNPRLPTGDVEVIVVEATVFNKAETPAFEIADQTDTREEIRLEKRYLDLRRTPLQQNLVTRHRVNLATRNYLSGQGCLELETPFLVKYTPGGARNFLVPARLLPGKFFALAESPQLYKQLFMVAGFDRYFQIVKCFRDEDSRLDRQPEFTQIDIELSFTNQDEIFRLVEGLVFAIWKEALGIDLHELYPTGRFPEMPYETAMRSYGSDKPDLRFDLQHVDLTDLILDHAGGGVPFWTEISDKYKSGALRLDIKPEIVKAIVIPAAAGLSRPQLEELEKGLREIKGFRGLARAKVGDAGEWTQSPFAKSITDELRLAINAACGARPGDVIAFQFGKESLVHTVTARLRSDVAKRMGLIPEFGHGGKWSFLWVTNPPLFELDEETGRYAAAHHAFTRPVDEHLPLLEADPSRVLCYRYDIVLNGFEIGGGSVRLHDPDVQKRVFAVLGIGEDEAREKFGFLLDALKSGAPPHGGIALGMDRLAMLVAGAQTLRDVIPFPKSNQATDLMTGAPVAVDASQLAELRIKTV
jgi:aspartyl-tRNA synthetase